MTPTSTSSEPAPSRVDDIRPVADLSRAPLPTAATLRRRNSPVLQLSRFIAFNLRILRMAATNQPRTL